MLLQDFLERELVLREACWAGFGPVIGAFLASRVTRSYCSRDRQTHLVSNFGGAAVLPRAMQDARGEGRASRLPKVLMLDVI